MSYRFNGSGDCVEFSIAPFSGYVFGPCTAAAFVRRSSIGTFDGLVGNAHGDTLIVDQT